MSSSFLSLWLHVGFNLNSSFLKSTNILYIYILSLIAAPYWMKEPVSQLYAPGETVRLDCQADGIPTPTISWTMNGIPLSG